LAQLRKYNESIRQQLRPNHDSRRSRVSDRKPVIKAAPVRWPGRGSSPSTQPKRRRPLPGARPRRYPTQPRPRRDPKSDRGIPRFKSAARRRLATTVSGYHSAWDDSRAIRAVVPSGETLRLTRARRINRHRSRVVLRPLRKAQAIEVEPGAPAVHSPASTATPAPRTSASRAVKIACSIRFRPRTMSRDWRSSAIK
jgi:hypothetical protein